MIKERKLQIIAISTLVLAIFFILIGSCWTVIKRNHIVKNAKKQAPLTPDTQSKWQTIPGPDNLEINR